jgi:hypothetical protein
MATVDNMVTPIISVIRRCIITIAYGVIRLVARRFLVMLMCQYVITDNCYKAFLLLSTSKLFQGTLLTFNIPHTSSLFLNLSVLSHERTYTRVFFYYLTFYSAVHISSYTKLKQ